MTGISQAFPQPGNTHALATVVFHAEPGAQEIIVGGGDLVLCARGLARLGLFFSNAIHGELVSENGRKVSVKQTRLDNRVN